MFNQLIENLKETNQLVSESISFQDYLRSSGLKANRTAQYISINRFHDLRQELKNNGYMVFRLGSPKGSRNTYFSLVKKMSDWSDFFFIDEELFGNERLTSFDYSIDDRILIAFKVLPRLNETSLVNLALATGLLHEVLGLKNHETPVAPATLQSTFTFDFRPLSQSPKKISHMDGQVEIDSIFTGKRNGRDCIFIVEAKTSSNFDTLAKHKLYYPILALQDKISTDIEIIPIYLRIIKRDKYIEFNVAECKIPRVNGIFGALNELKNMKTHRVALRWNLDASKL